MSLEAHRASLFLWVCAHASTVHAGLRASTVSFHAAEPAARWYELAPPGTQAARCGIHTLAEAPYSYVRGQVWPRRQRRPCNGRAAPLPHPARALMDRSRARRPASHGRPPPPPPPPPPRRAANSRGAPRGRSRGRRCRCRCRCRCRGRRSTLMKISGGAPLQSAPGQANGGGFGGGPEVQRDHGWVVPWTRSGSTQGARGPAPPLAPWPGPALPRHRRRQHHATPAGA
eukprot:scaffold4518_cov410-Prasinococcus_capsulatus_cf.AAC.21